MAIGTGAAIIGAAAVGAIASNNAANKAAKAQRAATNSAIGEQQRQYDLQREDFAPYRAAGVKALGDLQTQMSRPVTSRDVMLDPGYQFGLQQGQQALDRRIAASGGRVSGAALKAASRFGTDYASTGFNAAYQRRQDALNRLAAIAGIGQTATGASAAAGQQSANAISNLISSQGDATAAAQLGRGQLWANTGNQIAAMYARGGFGNQQATGYGQTGYDYSHFRADDPYRNPGYVGGSEGE